MNQYDANASKPSARRDATPLAGALDEVDSVTCKKPLRQKLAQRLAEQLSRQILESGLEEGASLGNEAQLAERLSASRWTVREAINILEREAQIEIRRGRYGGIFVAALSINALSTSIRTYLEFIRVDVREIIEMRQALDEAILSLALKRVTVDDVASLRQMQDLESQAEGAHAGFLQYEALLATARSPVLRTFVHAVGQLGLSSILRSNLSDDELRDVLLQVRLKRREQIEAVIAGRLGDAMQIETAVLEAGTRLLTSARACSLTDTASMRLRALHVLVSTRRFKRPELLMQEIASDIVARGWPVGEHLGTETELLARYHVSRTTFREAVRSLEQLGVVEMRSGRQSGLKIGSPNPDTVIRNSRRHFARMGLTHAHRMEAFATVGTTAAGMAARRRLSIPAPEPRSDSIRRYFNALGEASGNRIVALLMRILTPPEEGSGASTPDPDPQRASLLQHLAAATAGGDEAVARRAVLGYASASGGGSGGR